MTTKEEKLAAEDKHGERQRRSGEIGRQVLRVLGRPDDFRTVDVRPLWANCYRANVLVGADATTVRIAHSYFLEADGDGSIIQSNPPIMRVYGGEISTPGNIPPLPPGPVMGEHETRVEIEPIEIEKASGQ